MTVLWVLLACAEPPRFPDPITDLLSKMDADGSGDLNVSELRGDAASRAMAIVDRDKNARLNPKELRHMMARISSQQQPPHRQRKQPLSELSARGAAESYEEERQHAAPRACRDRRPRRLHEGPV